MHRQTRLLLILSVTTLLAMGGLLLLLRYSSGLRGPVAVLPPAVVDDAPQGQTPVPDAGADAAARALLTSPDGPPSSAPAPEEVFDPEAAEQANWRATQQLSFEQGVVIPGGLSKQGSDALLRAADFAQRMPDLSLESGRDPEAADMTRVYREAIERSLREGGGRARLGALACGTQLCVGMLVGGGADDYDTWAQAFAKRADAPTYSMNIHIATDAGGTPTLRFAFTVDPAFGGIVVEGV